MLLSSVQGCRALDIETCLGQRHKSCGIWGGDKFFCLEFKIKFKIQKKYRPEGPAAVAPEALASACKLGGFRFRVLFSRVSPLHGGKMFHFREADAILHGGEN